MEPGNQLHYNLSIIRSDDFVLRYFNAFLINQFFVIYQKLKGKITTIKNDYKKTFYKILLYLKISSDFCKDYQFLNQNIFSSSFKHKIIILNNNKIIVKHKLLSFYINNIKRSFKIKSTNNDCYRVQPVFGFVDAGNKTAVELTRKNGAPGWDNFVIEWRGCTINETEPWAPFQRAEGRRASGIDGKKRSEEKEVGQITMPVQAR